MAGEKEQENSQFELRYKYTKYTDYDHKIESSGEFEDTVSEVAEPGSYEVVDKRATRISAIYGLRKHSLAAVI